MEYKVDPEFEKEIESYCALPIKFDHFVDMPELSDGVVSLSCTLTKMTTPGIPGLPKVPGYYFNISTCNDGVCIGDINLRTGYNEELYYSGNTGYRIYEPYRGHGYAVRACRLLKPILKAHNMEKILITNAHDNHASVRVCEKLGAKFLRTVRVPQWHVLFRENGRDFQNIFEWSMDEVALP